MEKTLYVHIGTAKTGTSAIQKFCKINQERLEKNGYCYPMFRYKYEGISNVRNGHFLLGKMKDSEGKRLRNAEKELFAEGIEMVKEMFKTHDAVVLSEENIWVGSSDWAKGLIEKLYRICQEEGVRLVLVVYLRRQDEYLLSLWNQLIKAGQKDDMSALTFDEWLPHAKEKKPLHYEKKLEELVAIIGRENMVVRKYEWGSFYGGTIYEDFLQAIGLEMTDDYIISKDLRNLSLKGNNATELKREINKISNMSRDTHRFFVRILQEVSDKSEENKKASVLSTEDRKKILAEYEEGNRYIQKEYFGEEGDLFKPVDENIEKWQKNNKAFAKDRRRFIRLTISYGAKEILRKTTDGKKERNK